MFNCKLKIKISESEHLAVDNNEDMTPDSACVVQFTDKDTKLAINECFQYYMSEMHKE